MVSWRRSDGTRHFQEWDEPKGLTHSFAILMRASATYEDLVQSEARFRALVENSSDLVATHRIAKPGYSNFTALLRSRSWAIVREELVGRSVFSFLHPDDVELSPLSPLHIGRKADASSLNPTETRFRHKDGSWRVLEVRARELPSRTGSVALMS